MTRANYTRVDYSHLLRLVSDFGQHRDRAEATVSTWITGHARLFSRLRDGKGCNAHTYQDAMDWFAKNWPADLEWPVEVPRPNPTPTTERKSA